VLSKSYFIQIISSDFLFRLDAKGTCSLAGWAKAANKINNIFLNFLKIFKKHIGSFKIPLQATCSLRAAFEILLRTLSQLCGFHRAFRDTVLFCLCAIIGQKSIVLRSHEKSGDKGQKQSSRVERQHSETARETIRNP